MKKEKILSYSVFIICYLLLTWAIIFKCNLLTSDMRFGVHSINLIPFNLITRDDYWLEYLLNIVVYIPFGVVLYNTFKNKSMLFNIIFITLTSVLYETIQYIIYFGSSDISDVITNALGGIIGIYISKYLNKYISFKYINFLIIIIGIPLIIFAIIQTINVFPIYLEFIHS